MSAIQKLLTDHIDIWTAADTEKKSGRGRSSGNAASVYGVKKLRELILELAMRGKLVPQNNGDEPASELLKRNRVEKASLIAEGMINKDKLLPLIVKEEYLFDLHPGWCIERLGNIAHLITKGTTPTSIGFTYQKSGIRFVKVENVSDGRVRTESIDQYISEEADMALARSRLLPNDILFSIAGTIGRTCIIYPEDLPANTNQAFAIIRGTETVFYQKFLLMQLDSFVSDRTKEKARGGAMYNVSLSDIAKLVLVIPPLSEQHRIVAKVDELMALCDQLEAQHNNAADAHEKLVSHLLGTLTESQNAEDFSDNWQRIAAHFDTLFTTEASIDALKQTLLQLVVMGKLVPQDPNDEPAIELLKRIQAEKIRLSEASGRKLKEDVSAASVEEGPFEIPTEWSWCCLGETGIGLTGKTPSTEEEQFFGGDIPFIGPGQITTTGELLVPEKSLTEAGIKKSTEGLPNDILMVCIGGSIGKSVVNNKRVAFNQQINAIRPIFVQSAFLNFALSTNSFYNSVLAAATGSATPIISRSKWEKLLVPIAPLSEQHRIVAKVNELMKLCSQLKSRLTAVRQLQLKLADAFVEQSSG